MIFKVRIVIMNGISSRRLHAIFRFLRCCCWELLIPLYTVLQFLLFHFDFCLVTEDAVELWTKVSTRSIRLEGTHMGHQGLDEPCREAHITHRQSKIISRGSNDVRSKDNGQCGSGHMIVL